MIKFTLTVCFAHNEQTTLKQSNQNINNNTDKACVLSVNQMRSHSLIYARDISFGTIIG